MAAIALIENGLDWQQAVDLIRKNRRGAINRKQLKYLENYVPQRSSCCVIV
jgi:protein tyrosine phosphatase type 4A